MHTRTVAVSEFRAVKWAQAEQHLLREHTISDEPHLEYEVEGLTASGSNTGSIVFVWHLLDCQSPKPGEYLCLPFSNLLHSSPG